jgi:hypothetical protein
MGASGLAVHPHGLGQHPRQTPEAGLLSERFGVAAARGSGEAPRWRHHQERPRHASVTARRILLLVPTRAGGRAEAAGSPRRYAMDRLDVVVHGGWFCGPVPPCSCHDWPTGPQGHRVGHHSAPGRRERDDRTSRSRPGQGPGTGAGMGCACWQRPGNCRRPVDGDGGESPSRGGGPCRDYQAQGTHQRGTFTSLSPAGFRAGSVQVRDASTGICPGQAGLDPAGSAR